MAMVAMVLDGKQLAQTMQGEIAAGVADMVQRYGVRPGLAAVLIGDNPASQTYVRNKRKASQQVGIESWLQQLQKETSQAHLLDLVGRLNGDPDLHGILVH